MKRFALVIFIVVIAVCAAGVIDAILASAGIGATSRGLAHTVLAFCTGGIAALVWRA